MRRLAFDPYILIVPPDWAITVHSLGDLPQHLTDVLQAARCRSSAIATRAESAFGANPAALEQGIRSLSVMTAVPSL